MKEYIEDNLLKIKFDNELEIKELCELIWNRHLKFRKEEIKIKCLSLKIDEIKTKDDYINYVIKNKENDMIISDSIKETYLQYTRMRKIKKLKNN